VRRWTDDTNELALKILYAPVAELAAVVAELARVPTNPGNKRYSRFRSNAPCAAALQNALRFQMVGADPPRVGPPSRPTLGRTTNRFQWSGRR